MKKYISLIAVFFAVGITGCKKNYLDLENNPNQPSITTPQLSLAASEVTAAAIVATDYPEYGVWSGYWTTSGNYTPNPAINEYQLNTGTYTGVWDDLYLNLSNLNTLQSLSAQTAGDANFEAIAIILKAYDFEQLVDNFNDVPYSQAFNPKILTPVYDKGEDIYHDLGKQLDAAIALIAKNPNATSPATSDVIFQGNMTNWEKFANTLKLRLAIRVSTKLGASDPLVTDLASTSSVGYLDGTTQATANPGYTQSLSGSGASQESPFYGDYGFDVNGNPEGNNVYYRANAYGVNFYSSNNDPRLAEFYLPTSSGSVYRGNIFGDILNNQSNPTTSAIGPGILVSANQNAGMFSGAESLFLQAEAALNGYITGDPQALFEAGITASFESLGLTDAQASTYYSQPTINISYATSPNKQEAIIVQKWAALNGLYNLEAYNEYRRTGFPVLPTSVDPSAIAQTLPSRILYPTSELTTNDINLAKEGTINQFTSKIFWAK